DPVELAEVGREGLRDVVLDQAETGVACDVRDVATEASVEVVEPDDGVPLGQKPVHEVRADESGRAGDKAAHHGSACFYLESLCGARFASTANVRGDARHGVRCGVRDPPSAADGTTSQAGRAALEPAARELLARAPRRV